MIQEEKFLYNLTKYVVKKNLLDQVYKSKTANQFFELYSKELPDLKIYQYSFYEVQEALPLFKQYAENEIHPIITRYVEDYYYLHLLLECLRESQISMKEWCYSEKKIFKPTKKTEETISPEVKELIEGFEKFQKRQKERVRKRYEREEVKENEHKGTRKRKKIST